MFDSNDDDSQAGPRGRDGSFSSGKSSGADVSDAYGGRDRDGPRMRDGSFSSGTSTAGDVSRSYDGGDARENARNVRDSLGLGAESEAISANDAAVRDELGISKEMAEALRNDMTEQRMARQGMVSLKDLNGNPEGYTPEQAGGYVNGKFAPGAGAVRARTAEELARYGIDISSVPESGKLSTIGIHNLPDAQSGLSKAGAVAAGMLSGGFAGPAGQAAGLIGGAIIDKNRLSGDLGTLGYDANMANSLANAEIGARTGVRMGSMIAAPALAAMGPIGLAASMAMKGYNTQAPRALVDHLAGLASSGVSFSPTKGDNDASLPPSAQGSAIAMQQPTRQQATIGSDFYDFLNKYGGTHGA